MYDVVMWRAFTATKPLPYERISIFQRPVLLYRNMQRSILDAQNTQIRNLADSRLGKLWGYELFRIKHYACQKELHCETHCVNLLSICDHTTFVASSVF